LSINQDVIFHVSIRPNENAIVRNHFHNGNWGKEERNGSCTRANESFELIITAERECYKLTINGSYLGSFKHRLPLHLVQFIHVSGKVSIDHILIEQDISQMNVNPYPSPIVPSMEIGVDQHSSSPSAPQPYFPQHIPHPMVSWLAS
jgi:Galactoside-binding lectin